MLPLTIIISIPFVVMLVFVVPALARRAAKRIRTSKDPERSEQLFSVCSDAFFVILFLGMGFSLSPEEYSDIFSGAVKSISYAFIFLGGLAALSLLFKTYRIKKMS